MKVSVVIVAKHAEKTIRYAVESLLRQTLKPHEIIVVVDSLTDPTVEAIEDLPIKLILNEGVGLGAARRTGVNASTGDVVAFIDADCIADETWIESLLEVFSESNAMVQAGSDRVKLPPEMRTKSPKLSSKNSMFLRFAPTLNFAFRKELINIIGNFDSWFKEGGEDLDFCIRLRKAGYRIFYNPDARVYHLTRRFSLRKAWRDGRSRARALVKHGNAMLNDASVCFFHSMSLLASLILFTIGHQQLALLVFAPSLIHRLYRATIGVKQGNRVLVSLLNSFAAYVSHISFTISLVSLALRKLWKCKLSN